MKALKRTLVGASNRWPWVVMLSVGVGVGVAGCGDGSDAGQAETAGAPTYVESDEPPMAPAQFGSTIDGSLGLPVRTGFLLARSMSPRFPAWVASGAGPQKLLGIPTPNGLGCMSFAPNGPSFTIVLDQCVIADDPITTLSGQGSAAYNMPSLDVALDATVTTPEATLNFGGDLHWADLAAKPVPDITLHGGVTTESVSANISSMQLVVDGDGYTGLIVFDVTHPSGMGVSSTGAVVSGDTESFLFSGPVVATADGVQVKGEARDIAIRYTELLPHGGSLAVVATVSGWNIQQRTFFQADTPESGWVLSHEQAQGQKPDGQTLNADRWDCVNLGTLETHEAAAGATCPVQ